jgi:hypothetical protein
MEIAAQHPEAIRESARIGVKKRLLLDGIALHAAYVAPGNVEGATLVVANLANPGLALRNRTAVSTGVAVDTVAIELLVQLTFAHVLVDDLAQSGHGTSVPF